MYYPYFRGKQYDLITVRENAKLLAESKIIPIIEPVKEALSGLNRAIDAVIDANGKLILIVNPQNGDHASNSRAIHELLQEKLEAYDGISCGILLTESMSFAEIDDICGEYESCDVTFIHAGFTDAKLLSESLGRKFPEATHVFFEEYCGKLYRKHFSSSNRVLLRDGFQRRANRLHPPVEFFSDLHITYPDEGMDGFGDFLIVGDDYSETGGPAYAVAIHLTFIDSERDDEMHIHHFKSIRYDTPTDPAGKFSEATQKLIDELARADCKILETNAVKEFKSLHARGHFPGLGYVKKLSMQHHIETLAEYITRM